MNPDLQEADLTYHKYNRFYNEQYLTKPEFMFKNHIIQLKETEVEMLEESLQSQDAEEERRHAMTSQGSGGSKMEKPKTGKGADPKAGKDKPAKGVTPVEDQNMPKNIEIEYEDIPEESDFMIMEKNFQGMKATQVEPKAASKTGTRQGTQTAQSDAKTEKGLTLE